MYLRNSWYIASWSRDLADTPIGIRMLERPLVLFRDSAGEAVLLDGRCPHRFAPLSRGVVQGDTLMCPYHGLVFDRAGTCIHNPHGSGMIPPGAKLRRYPVVEKNGAIWAWMGEADAADPSQISDIDWLCSPDYACITGHIKVQANYQLVVDNLLDLTHAPFLHQDTVGGRPEDSIGARMTHDFRTDPDKTIHSDYCVDPMPRPTPQMRPLWGERPSIFRSNMTWRPACRLELDISLAEPGANEPSLHLPSLHYLVPETDRSTHYFFAMGRDVMIDDEEQTRIMAEFARRAFEDEDEPMIRAVQDLMGTSDLMSLRPAILETDKAAVQARRVLALLIRQEETVPA